MSNGTRHKATRTHGPATPPSARKPVVKAYGSTARYPGVKDMDRTVHGVTEDGSEVVRYDRAGKWFSEWYIGAGLVDRRHITLADAVRLATAPGARTYLGRSGGTAFDARVRKVRS